MTDETTKPKQPRITKVSLKRFIQQTEDDGAFQNGVVPDEWQALRAFAGLPPLTQKDRVQDEIKKVNALIRVESDTTERRRLRAHLISLLKTLQDIEGEES